jgi:hypothetical protein
VTLSIVYDAAAFVRVYRFGWWGSAWRFVLSNAVALVLLGLSTALVLAGYLLW